MGLQRGGFTRRGQSQRVERHGKSFQSTTEADFYSALLRVGVPFQWQVEFVLQEGIPKNAKTMLLSGAGVHKIKCTVDFVFKDPAGNVCIVDTKGSKEFATERSVMAYHLLKGKVYRNEISVNGKTCDRIFTKILMIDRKEVLNLLNRSLSQDKTLFWAFFNQLKPF